MAVRGRRLGNQETDEVSNERPYPAGTDLFHLWAWGYQIEGWLYSKDFSVSEMDWVLIRPHQPAGEAMMAFSVDFAPLINELKQWQRDAESRLQEVLDNENEDTRFAYTDVLDVLCSRIRKACEIISGRTEPKSVVWITLEDATRLCQRDKGTVSRAASNGLIGDNGIRGKGRRFDSASVTKYFLENSAE